MNYPKKVMRISELRAMGFPEELLLRAFRSKGQTFANKVNPFKSNSPIVFDVEGFEKWRLSQVRASQRIGVM